MTSGPLGGPRPFSGVPIAVVTNTENRVSYTDIQEINKVAEEQWGSLFEDQGAVVNTQRIKGETGVVVVVSIKPEGGPVRTVIQSIMDGETSMRETVDVERVEKLASIIEGEVESKGYKITKQRVELG